MALTAAERQRRCRLKRKAVREKYEEYLKKARDRYHANKKLVKDMSEREKRVTNRKWRIKQMKRRIKLKEQQRLVDADTPSPSPPCSPNTAIGRKKIRRDRSKLYRNNLKLEIEKAEWRRKYEACKKQLQRTKQEKETYEVLCKSINETFAATKSRKDRKLIKDMVTSDCVAQRGLTDDIRFLALGIKNKEKIAKRQCIQSNLKNKIRGFFLRDDVSRATAGKKETVTKNKIKRQKRFLLDTMKNLYKSFKKECNVKCSYAYFARHRPFYVVLPSADSRETCLCKLHTNINYKIITLNKKQAIPTKDGSFLLESVVCNISQMDCMYGICKDCREKRVVNTTNLNLTEEVSWWEWIRKAEEIQKGERTIKFFKNIKELKHAKLSDLVHNFEKDFTGFKKHIFNVRRQHKAYRDCIERLTPDSVVLHIDFSENYNCKMSQEIQAHHFGGSRNQLSLHTVVMYRKPEEITSKVISSFCTVSSSLAHSPSAIWAHLHPILKLINETYPEIDTIHL